MLMRRRRVIDLVAAAAACMLGACAASRTLEHQAPEAARRDAGFRLDKATLRANGAPADLIAKIDARPYTYFRLLSAQFAARTCEAFGDLELRLPSVAIHGDAHVEQFIVTRDSFGLEDFDRAGFGPAVVDLVRYAASIHVACRQAAVPCDAEAAVTSYFEAYRDALDRPVARTAPDIVRRLRAKSPPSTVDWLRSTDALMLPLAPAEEAAERRAWERFIDSITQVRPDRPRSFYDIVRMGEIRIGVGSALEKKVLFRVRGPSDTASDDVVLEARFKTASSAEGCVWRPPLGGSLHAMFFMSLLGSRMPDVFGFIPRDDNPEVPEFWIQAWDPGYTEFSLSDLQGQADLDQLAADAARQLAGHFWTTYPEPLRAHQRLAQLRAFDMAHERARSLAADLAAEAIGEWERFRDTSARTDRAVNAGRTAIRRRSDRRSPAPAPRAGAGRP